MRCMEFSRVETKERSGIFCAVQLQFRPLDSIGTQHNTCHAIQGGWYMKNVSALKITALIYFGYVSAVFGDTPLVARNLGAPRPEQK